MIKVAGCWEQGWITPMTEYNLWRFPLRDFGVDELIMSPVSGIAGRVTEFRDISSVITHNPTLTPVFVDECGEVELSEFQHPENVVYVLGRAGYSPMKSIGKGHLSVKIGTPGNGGRLWPHQAISMVLYDRVSKQ